MKNPETICDGCGEYNHECSCAPSPDAFRKRLWIEAFLQQVKEGNGGESASDFAKAAVDRFDKLFH